MRRAAHIVVLAMLLTALCACSRNARVIPPERMARLYYDMFLADQWLRDNPRNRAAADTTLFFDPIFRRHGVTFEDYDRSLQYYMDRPDDFTKILEKVADRLNKDGERLQLEANELTAAEYERDKLRRTLRAHDFTTDSSRWDFPQRLWPENDTTKHEKYGLPAEIRLHSRGEGGSEPDSIRGREPKRPRLRGSAEEVLLPDGFDHVEVQ